MTFWSIEHQFLQNSATSTRVSSLAPSKSKSSVFKTPDWRKRRTPVNGFNNSCQYMAKRQKLEDSNIDYSNIMNYHTGLKEFIINSGVGNFSSTVCKFNHKPSIYNFSKPVIVEEEEERIEEDSLWIKVKKSTVYRCLMYGVQSLKAASFLVLSNIIYYAWPVWSPSLDISNVYKNDKIVQAILNKENLSMGEIVGHSSKHINVNDLIEKYSTHVNFYLDKIKAENSENFEWTTLTTKLIILWLASLAWMVLFMKCK